MEKIVMKLTDGLQVSIMPNVNHEFLMTTKDVAMGYDISEATLRSHKHNYKSDLKEGKHFVKIIENTCVDNINAGRLSNTYILWTKAGVVRLAMFIRSERAILFRDWIEQIVLNYIEHKLPELPETPKRKHNRLTQDRLLDIMSDVCLIQDEVLRIRIRNKLVGK